MTDDAAYERYGQQFIEMFSKLLETDADIARALFLIVCSPHLTDAFVKDQNNDSFFSSYGYVTRQNEHLEGKDEAGARLLFAELEGQRQEEKNKLGSYGAIAAWEKETGKNSTRQP